MNYLDITTFCSRSAAEHFAATIANPFISIKIEEPHKGVFKVLVQSA